MNTFVTCWVTLMKLVSQVTLDSWVFSPICTSCMNRSLGDTILSGINNGNYINCCCSAGWLVRCGGWVREKQMDRRNRQSGRGGGTTGQRWPHPSQEMRKWCVDTHPNDGLKTQNSNNDNINELLLKLCRRRGRRRQGIVVGRRSQRKKVTPLYHPQCRSSKTLTILR